MKTSVKTEYSETVIILHFDANDLEYTSFGLKLLVEISEYR